MPDLRMNRTLLAALCLFAGLFGAVPALAQQARYWVGGSGAWSDAAHWALTPGGPGGAGAPSAHDPAVIGPLDATTSIFLAGKAAAAGLTVDGAAQVRLQGHGGHFLLQGDLSLKGDVDWAWPGILEVRADAHAVRDLDTRGIPLASDVVLSGGGAFNLMNDLVLRDGHGVELREGIWVLNGSMLKAETLAFSGNKTKKLIAGSSLIQLAQPPGSAGSKGSVEAIRPNLLVNGSPAAWPDAHPVPGGEERGTSLCGVGAGQTLFTITASLMSDYNGYGVSCHNVCDGIVQVAVTGGVGPFAYAWIGGPTSATWNNVCPGNQIVIVTDLGQGVSCATTVQVTDPARLSVIFTGSIPPSCAGNCDGTTTAFAVGGVPNYTFSWNNGQGSGQSFNQLCPGLNTLQVIDANGCTFDTTFNFPVIPIDPHLTTADVQCFGDCNGTAQVAPTGGAAPYGYNWQPGNPPGDGTPAVTGLCAGIYSVTITDANGCDTTVALAIQGPQALLPNPAQVNATCADNCDGSATVAPSGGSGDYGYNWTPTPGGGGGTATATGLCLGLWTVTITDNVSGCDTVVNFNITAPPAIVPTPASTDATCASSCDGTASAPATGGAGPLTYTWSPNVTGQGTPNASLLCPGAYSLVISDGTGCDTTLLFNIAAPPALLPSADQTDILCAGDCDGTAGGIVTGGTAPYTYLWTPVPPAGQGTPMASQLCPGPIALTITDANGCDTTVQYTIAEPPPLLLVASQTDLQCGSVCNGSATVTVSGGTPNYTYAWTPAPPQGQGTANASQLCPGTWTVLVTDANGCTLTHAFNILPATPITASVQTTPVSCPGLCDATAIATVSGGVPGYTLVWAPAPAAGQGTLNATGLCAGPGTLTITDAAGCDTTVAFTIAAPPAIQVAATVADASCAGACDGSILLTASGGNGTFTYVWIPASAGTGPNATGLCAGNYQVTVTSGVCDTTLDFTIDQPPPFNLTLSTTPPICADDCSGTATLTGDLSGLTIVWTPQPGSGQGTGNAGGLCAGNWSVTASSAGGCDTTIAFSIDQPDPLVVQLQLTNASCGTACDGSATATVSGGVPGYTYLWSPEPGSGQGSPAAAGLCSGAYSLTLTDAAGCDTVLAFNIVRPSGIVASGILVPASCPDACDGSILATATGGQPPFTWTWAPEPPLGQGTPSVNDLCPGTWTLTIGDLAGCDTILSFDITAPDLLDAGATLTPVSCAGACNGAIDLNPQGGSGAYTFSWTPQPPIGDGTANISGLCAGDWNVIITDSLGCDSSFTFTITENAPLALIVETLPSHCGVCDGSAVVHATGGMAPYTFAFGPPLSLTTADSTVIGLCAGLYPVTVSDANGCSLQTVVAITDADGEALTITDGSTSCPGLCDGAVSVAYNCSVAPCTVSWADQFGNPLGQSGDSLQALCAGNYIVTVTNANGCISIAMATVAEPAPLAGNLSSTPASCIGACDGTGTVNISGGIGPFTFTWTPAPGGTGQGMPHAQGLCPGNYAIHVDDQGGCDADFNLVIAAPTPITAAPVVSPISCNNACDGSIQLNAQGGTGAITYVWSPAPPTGQGTPNAGGLCPGTWSVLLFDGNNCDTTLVFSLTDPAPLSLSTTATMSHCTVCDGSATVTVAGGTAPISTAWLNNGVPVGSDTAMSGLCAGVYTVTATDANGCSSSMAVTVPDESAPATATTDGNTSCATTCDGSVSVSYTCTVPPCTVTWSDALGLTLAQGADSLSGLCPGTYLVEVADGDGCTAIDTATVTPGVTLIPNLSTVDANCNGTCDGSAAVAPTGGMAPYSYQWSNGDTTAQINGLCPGAYTVTIADAAGCDTLVQLTIGDQSLLSVAAQVEHVSCNAACDGSIELFPAGGSGTYTYVWSPVPPSGLGSATASGLCPGSWSVTVADVNGCDTTLVFTIQEPAPLTVTTVPVNTDCQVCNGAGTAQVSGGTAPYAVAWLQGTTIIGTDTAISGLCSGLYRAAVQDANGCLAQAELPINDLGGETIDASNTLLDCPASCDGQVFVDYNCASPACNVAWFAANGTDLGVSTDTLSNLCAGVYYVQVTNGAGCTTLDTAHVVPPPAIQANLSTTPETCAGNCDGTATVGPTGGNGAPYTYFWQPDVAGQGSPQATALCAGNYTVTITDRDGCFIDQGVIILAPQPLNATATVVPNSCNGATDGEIILSTSGGTGVITYAWSPTPPVGQGSAHAQGLGAGSWSVVISDQNGCDTTLSFALTDPSELVLDVSHTDNLCFNACVATAHLDITGGVAPYAIGWNGPNGPLPDQDVTDVNGLCGGAYEVVVTDSLGCSRTVSFTVGAGSPMEANLVLQGESCNGPCDGFATVAPTGGAGSGYGYFWQPDVTGQGTANATALCPGNYTILISDIAGCDTTYAFTIAPFAPLVPSATVQDVSCNGACDGAIDLAVIGGVGGNTYAWTPEPPIGQGTANVSGLCAQAWTVTITDAAGCDTSITVTVLEPPALVITQDSVQPASCNTASDGAISITVSGGSPGYGWSWIGPEGFTASTEDLTGLVAGNYLLTVTDQMGCTATMQVLVRNESNVIADAGADLSACFGAPITLDGSASIGAITYVWNEPGTGPVGNAAVVTVTGVPPGMHMVVLTVSDGACWDTDTVLVQVAALPGADAGPDQDLYLHGTVNLGGAPSGPPGSSFHWWPDSLLDQADVPNPAATVDATTWFVLTVTSPDGCVSTDSVLVNVVPEIIVPSGFTPNTDGHNDVWVLDFADLFPAMDVRVFSRWGEPLFHSVGYAVPWDGKVGGTLVPVGTYYYAIELNDPRFPEPLTGPLTVIR
jgi:gliding motility-associated-like protein